MPWAWKTTISKALWEKLKMPVFDIDDDCLEVVWWDSVANKLEEFWEEKFLEEEWKACLSVEKENTIIALSGSVPLHKEAMNHFRKMWTVIYLQPKLDSIEKRLAEMQVDRIIWMKNKTLWEILKYRLNFYESCYDIRINLRSETPEEIVDVILWELKKEEWFKSTRWFEDEKLDFLEVVKWWLAEDWGLYIAKKFPKFRDNEIKNLENLTYQETALRVIEKFPMWRLSPTRLRELIYSAYWEKFQNEEITPIEKLDWETFLLELFKGQTWAFKDLALQLTPRFFSEATKWEDTKYLVLAATSWDTWVAAIEGFKSNKNISILVLYPKNWVSPLQKIQMLSQSWSNILVLWVDSNFDFCQKSVKNIFKDKEFRKNIEEKFNTKLWSWNSINWGRLMPQVVYYIFSYLRLIKKWELKFWEKLDICVPSWNFWNLLAAYFAKEMWVPLWRLICASNDNNILNDFIKTWAYDLRWRDLKRTDSPSIDILKSSNIERILYLLSWENSEEIKQYFEDLEEKWFFKLKETTRKELKKHFDAWFCTNEESLNQIKETLEKTGYLMDTHTAVAKKVADELKWKNKILIASTAHYWKFPNSIFKALWLNSEWKNLEEMLDELEKKAQRPAPHKELRKALKREIVQKENCRESLEEIKEKMLNFLDR